MNVNDHIYSLLIICGEHQWQIWFSCVRVVEDMEQH